MNRPCNINYIIFNILINISNKHKKLNVISKNINSIHNITKIISYFKIFKKCKDHF